MHTYVRVVLHAESLNLRYIKGQDFSQGNINRVRFLFKMCKNFLFLFFLYFININIYITCKTIENKIDLTS